MSDVEQPPPLPTPQPSQAQYLPVTHQVWAGVNPVVSPLVLESPPRPTFLANNPEGYTGPRASTRWQEAYNLYLLHEETNKKARQAVSYWLHHLCSHSKNIYEWSPRVQEAKQPR